MFKLLESLLADILCNQNQQYFNNIENIGIISQYYMAHRVPGTSKLDKIYVISVSTNI